MLRKIIASLFVSVASFSALSSPITLDSRSIDSTLDNTDFISSWNNQTSLINSQTLSSFNNHQTGNSAINRLSFDFSLASIGSWGFQAGLDAGFGAAFYLDGNLITNRTDDLWWQSSWFNADVISATDVSISSGNHTFEIYWAENCCNGPSSVRFTADGQNWQALTSENLKSSSVPEPLSFALLGLALIGFSFSRKQL